ncbi:MAG: Bax inhibitor-1/YccA family protein [SAR324 cluster bacterium]|nr:Bax inhibitor-1/YccA family protein [SAR324 cluster bacterium]
MFNTQQTAMYQIQSVAQASVGERIDFLKKVYSLLAASLGTATIGAFLGTGPLLPVVAPNMFLFFILEIALIFFASYAQNKPGLNIVALFSFTTVSGLTLGPVLYRYSGTTVVVEALALTAVTFAGLSVYVITSKKDFSFMSGFLFTGLMIVLVGSLLNMFFFHSPVMHFVTSGVCVFLFSGYILYDTSNIIRNYGTDQYIMAVLALYLDILNLFMALLSILGLSRND